MNHSGQRGKVLSEAKFELHNGFAMRIIPFLLAVVFLAGCGLLGGSGDQRDEAAFTTERSSYALGSTVKATLANTSDGVVGYNLCPSRLERKQGSDWVFTGPSIICTDILHSLRPGEKEPYRIELADSLAPSEGIYRLTTGVEIEGESVTIATKPFDVSVTVQQR